MLQHTELLGRVFFVGSFEFNPPIMRRSYRNLRPIREELLRRCYNTRCFWRAACIFPLFWQDILDKAFMIDWLVFKYVGFWIDSLLLLPIKNRYPIRWLQPTWFDQSHSYLGLNLANTVYCLFTFKINICDKVTLYLVQNLSFGQK